MTDRRPKFNGPGEGTCTAFARKPGLARTRAEIRDLRASGHASRPAGGEWSSGVTADVSVGAKPWEAETARLELSGAAALGFGLDLLEGAISCYLPRPFLGRFEEEREEIPLPKAEELRLLGAAARAARWRSPETEADLAWLADLCARTSVDEWAGAGRHEAALADLQRAGLIEVQGFGGMTRARATDDGRALAAGIGGRA